MNKKWMLLTAIGLVVSALVLSLAVPALAQEATTPTPEAQARPEKGPRLWFDRSSWATFDTVAGALGMTPTELFAELHSGKSVSEVAEAKGVDLQEVQDAVEAARLAKRKAEIAQAVDDGEITQEQADWMLKGLEQGWTLGRGGHDHGRGGRGLPPDGMRSSGTATSVAPGASSL